MSGVYGLFREGSLVYIGQSGVPEYRIGQHIKQRKKEFDHYEIFDPVVFLTGDELKQLEHHMIMYHRPLYNKHGVTNKGWFSYSCELGAHPCDWDLYSPRGLRSKDFALQCEIMLAGINPIRELQRIRMGRSEFIAWWEKEAVQRHHRRTRQGKVYRTLYQTLNKKEED